MKTIAIIFGGKSVEHEVSVKSAKHVAVSIDAKKYKTIFIGISKKGLWRLIEQDVFESLEVVDDCGVEVVFLPASDGMLVSRADGTFLHKVDVVFPVLHGQLGEDGTLQGYLRIIDIPFVGCDVLSSAISMDKEIAKRLLSQAGIRVAKYISVNKNDYRPNFDEIQKRLGKCIFLKPTSLGSSVGVHKIKDEEELQGAYGDAFKYCDKVIIEEAIIGRELECAVLQTKNGLIISHPGEIILKDLNSFYSYEVKYILRDAAKTAIREDIENVQEMIDIVKKTFETLRCEGLARIDFFLASNGEIIINEANTLPGFTSISMYPKLLKHIGFSNTDILDCLIENAFLRYKMSKEKETSFSLEK